MLADIPENGRILINIKENICSNIMNSVYWLIAILI